MQKCLALNAAIALLCANNRFIWTFFNFVARLILLINTSVKMKIEPNIFVDHERQKNCGGADFFRTAGDG